MSFTQAVESWIKPAEQGYIRTVDGLLVSVRKPISQINSKAYIGRVIRQMEAVRQEFCNCYLGFSLIRRLHEKLARETDNPVLCEIEGTLLHVENTKKPSVLHEKYPDDLKKYVEVFTQLAKNSGRIIVGKDISEGLLCSRFTKILSENRYVGVKGGTTEISREDIIDVCIYLGWNSDDANYLLLRMDDSCLSGNCASDLISRFVLDVPEATMSDRKALQKAYRKALDVSVPLDMEDKIPEGTRDRVDLFGKILENNDQLSRKKLREKYEEALVFYAPVFELPSLTARNYLERILRVAYVRMGNTDAAIPTDPSNVKLIIFQSGILPLAPHERERMIEALLSESTDLDANVLSGNDPISYNIAYDMLAYPVVSKSGVFAQKIMGARLIRLLAGEEHINKQDMLYALYLMESIKWETKKVVDAKTLSDRYTDFKVLANDVLTESFLPPFYPVQTLEFVIGKAIMSGLRVDEVFTEVTRHFDSLKDPEIDQLTDIPKEEKDIIPNEDFAYKKIFSNLVNFLYLRTSKIVPNPENDTEDNADNIMQELSDIARKLYDIWQSVQFDSLDVNFEKAGQIGVKAVGLSENAKYTIIWTMSAELKRLLHGADVEHTMLEEFYIPDLDGKRLSIAEYAKQYLVDKHGTTLLSVLIQNADWNRRLRRKIILSVIVGMILNLYGKKSLEDKYRRSKAKKADTKTDPEKAILQIISDNADDEEEQESFSFFDIYPKDKTLLKLYPASKDDYESHLEKKLVEN